MSQNRKFISKILFWDILDDRITFIYNLLTEERHSFRFPMFYWVCCPLSASTCLHFSDRHGWTRVYSIPDRLGWQIEYICFRRKHFGRRFYSGGMGAREYYGENNGWVYRWDVPHNVADLISLMGGNERFIANLDRTFLKIFR